jgi:hypothetical protein
MGAENVTGAPVSGCGALLCPSAQPDMRHSRVIGVVGGTAQEPSVSYLDEPQPVTDELLALAAPLNPPEVYRFAAECEESKCCHFDGKDCRLATRIVQILPAVVNALPTCRIRPECRWFQQEGRAACLRCPQVITQNFSPTEAVVQAATPA